MSWVRAITQSDRGFYAALGALVVVKLVLAGLLPVAGDEAYFTVWANHLAIGYYDHPPMAGWLMWLIMQISEHRLVLRLPAILGFVVVALMMHAFFRERDAEKARAVTLLFFATPVFLIPTLLTTDTPLIIFGAISALLLYRAVSAGGYAYFAGAGLFFGLAFLSKYFAVLLAVSYLVYFVIYGRAQWRGFVLLFAVALPFGLLNLYYNYNQCWYNILFNLVNRPGGDGFDSGNLLLYLISLLYLFTPWLLWHVWRHRGELRDTARRYSLGFFAVVAGVPLLLFLLLGGFRTVGLHWLLLFVLLLHPLWFALPRASLQRLLAYMAVFSAVHVVVVVGFLLSPVQWLGSTGNYDNLVFYLEPGQVAEALEGFEADVYATSSYSASATLSYNTGRYWAVFGTGSRYAREDDRITDWRALDGGSMLFLHRDEVRMDRIEPYFENVEVTSIEVAGARFELAEAQGFDYATYREDVLKEVRERYYDIPDFLPVGNCDFLERHFGEDCPV